MIAKHLLDKIQSLNDTNARLRVANALLQKQVEMLTRKLQEQRNV